MTEPFLTYHQLTQSVGPSVEPGLAFVTGGSGLVGSHLIQHLLLNGQPVRALYRGSIPDIKGKDKVEWVKGDILDILSLEDALVDVSYVYHCAAVVSFDPADKHKLFRTNIDGTANVVNASLSAGVQKLCYVSSVAALEKHKDATLLNESMTSSEEVDKSNYGKSKFYAEMEVWRAIGEGLKAVIVNPSIILGAGSWNEGSTKLFKTAYEEFEWYTEGVTGFVDINDLTGAMIQLMGSTIDNQRFIVSAENRTYKDIFTLMAHAFNKKPPHKKATRFLSQLVLTAQSIKSMFSDDKPLLTKETTAAAQAVVKFDNTKLLTALPTFSYTPIAETIKRVSNELKVKYKL